MAVMKSKQFVDTCIAIANSPTVYYSVAGGDWCRWNGSKWNMDCVCMIKGVLWGFNFNKSASHGGAIYGSNGVYDDDADQIMYRCTKISNDFKNIKIGEILHMGGHVGVYIGNRQVVETTAAWDYCTQISTVDENGARHKGNNYCGYWQNHGELSYIDYSDSPTPTPTKDVNVYYRVKTKDYGWLPEVKNLDDYAGWNNSPITAIAIKVDKGSISYKVHIKGGGWLPSVTGYNISDFNNGYAGDGREIDCIQVYYYTPDDIRPYKKAKYKVNNYDWQYDDETSHGQDGYAGVYGVNATEFRIVIE